LVGDPEQLGSVEAGGLFSAIAERTDPVHLHEVIRHLHEVDRDAAKLIREGRAREALSLYEEAERVTRSRTPPSFSERRWSGTGGAPSPRARTR
jgi:ATP-dependent exoDNAse (exonuclease V) alpha subunit